MQKPHPLGDMAAARLEPIAAPSHALLQDLHGYWLQKKGDRPAPPRAAIVPEEMPRRLLPHVAILDVIAPPPGFRFRFRLFGTALVRAYGEDLTGRFADKADLGQAGAAIHAQLTELVRDCRPVTARAHFVKDSDGRYIEYERVALPLSDDGHAVNMILAGYVAERAFS